MFQLQQIAYCSPDIPYCFMSLWLSSCFSCFLECASFLAPSSFLILTSSQSLSSSVTSGTKSLSDFPIRTYLLLILVSPAAQSCPILCDPMDCSTPGFLSIINSQTLLKLMCIEPMMPFNHLILCHPLFLLPSVFPRIKIFSSELALCIKWPEYWSFSFSISPSNEHSGLIFFKID